MLKRHDLQNIHTLAKQSKYLWPDLLKPALQTYWSKTLNDDKSGLISGLSLALLQDTHTKTEKLTSLVYNLGIAELYFWTAANLEDDLSDNSSTPKQYLPLLSLCRDLAWKYIYQTPDLNIKKDTKTNLLLTQACHVANFKELTTINKAPDEALSAANKSIFLLIGPMILIKQLNWTKEDKNNFLLAAKYFLAAKQLADDIYDYKEDWNSGHRSFVHCGLNQLPKQQELPAYFKKQANNILTLCKQSRIQLEKITSLKKHDCFDKQLDILKVNCQRSLSKISLKTNKI